MRKFSDEQVRRWSEMAKNKLAPSRMEPSEITTGKGAWAVAHLSGICLEAYEDRSVTDAHIQTALEKIFPNAVFRDAKRY